MPTSNLIKYLLALGLLASFSVSSFACTIFVLTDSKKTLFFNNEDYSNPSTKIWFAPGTKGLYGAAYLGFDNYWAQGGVNTKGLAYDWVAGYKNDWKPDLTLIQTEGNSGERMLESCGTVEEAIAFYKKYRESSFAYAKMLIADKTGASVIIGIKDGTLYFDRSSSSRGFGYGAETLSNMLSADTTPSLENGLPILDACKQKGTYATKYSNVFDLNSDKISLISFSGQTNAIDMNLNEELKKGGHYYDLPEIQSQFNQPIKLLPIKPVITKVPQNILKQYKGEYKINSEVYIKISVVNGRIFYQESNKVDVYELHASSEDQFFFKTIPPFITFIRDNKGKVIDIAIHEGSKTEKFKKIK